MLPAAAPRAVIEDFDPISGHRAVHTQPSPAQSSTQQVQPPPASKGDMPPTLAKRAGDPVGQMERPAGIRSMKAEAKALAQASKREKRLREHQPGLRATAGGHTILEEKAAGTSTKQDYLRKLAQFDTFTERHGIAGTPSESDFEKSLIDFMDNQYLDGRDRDWGEKIKAAIEWKWPELSKGGDLHLPRMRRSLRGWRKAAPNQLQWPLPEVIKHALSGAMMMNGDSETALKNLVDFVCYLRPSEGISLIPKDAIAPVSGETIDTAITLFPFEREARAKTHNFDETVLLDSPREPYLGALLQEHADARRNEGASFLWSFEAQDFSLAFKKAQTDLGIEVMELEPYQNRHGGVTRDLVQKVRTCEEARAKGRWASREKMRRYEKVGRLEQFLNKFPEPVVNFGRYVRDNWEYLFLDASELEFPLTKDQLHSLPSEPLAKKVRGSRVEQQVRRKPAADRRWSAQVPMKVMKMKVMKRWVQTLPVKAMKRAMKTSRAMKAMKYAMKVK